MSNRPRPRPAARWKFGQPVEVALATSGDVHTWRIRLTEGHGFHVTLSGLPADYDLHLFGPDGNRIAESMRGGTADELVAAPAAAPGEYELYVDSPLRQDSPAAYTLTAALNERISIANAARLDMFTRGHRGSVGKLAYSPDGQTIAGEGSRWVFLFDASLGAERFFTAPRSVSSVAFSPDGQSIASGSSDKTVRLWRVADGAPLHSLTGHTGPVWSVAFSPDGQILASGSGDVSGSYDTTIRLWRVTDGALLTTITHCGSSGVFGLTRCGWSVAFKPDGQILASSSGDIVRLWGVR